MEVPRGLGIIFAGAIDSIAGPGTALAATRSAAGYGPLQPDPAGILALPRGFSYKVVAEAGKTLLESGQPTPSDADGTANFASETGATLVNNHEVLHRRSVRVHRVWLTLRKGRELPASYIWPTPAYADRPGRGGVTPVDEVDPSRCSCGAH